MFRLIVAVCLASLLAGCFSFGGGGSPAGYNGYVQRYGMYLASTDVDNSCISPKLRTALDTFERKFGRKVVLNSGYRDPIRNILAGGEDSSYHMRCMAADIFMPGIDKGTLIAFAKRNPHVGGLGCYPGREFIHVDVRDRPRGWDKPITFSGC
jgi:zinc D-Ala-D-Ala carboxypeptidase